MKMRYGAVRRAERYIGLAVLAGVSSAAGAQQTQTAVLVSTGASVETNPYNTVNAGGESIAGTLEIRPLLRTRTELSTIDLSGSASFRQFVRRFGLEDNYSLNGLISTRVSERITLNSNAGFIYNEGGYNDFARRDLQLNNPAPVMPGSGLPDPSLIDVTLLGQRTRTKAFDFGVGADVRLNTYSTLSLNTSGRATRYKAVGFGDFNTISGRASYSHQLSETTSIGAVGSVSKTDYLRARVGDARTYSIQGSLDRRLGTNWTFWGSAGIAFTRIDQLAGQPDVDFQSLTAELRFCRNGEFSRFCLAGSRSPEPSANGNIRVTNVLQGDYSLRVSERENVTFSGSYARTGRGRGVAAALPGVDLVSGAVRYDNQLRDNLTFYASTNFSKIYTSIDSRRANFGVNAGLQFRFGALQ